VTKDGRKVVAKNRTASRNFEIIDTLEAGLVLVGSEVKSLRQAQCELKDAYASIDGNEAWLHNAHISPYKFARDGGHEPDRPRKLLLHRREIERLRGQLAEKGLTLVALEVYFKDGKAKVSLGVGKGKRAYDKRHKLREKEEKREMDRAAKRRR